VGKAREGVAELIAFWSNLIFLWLTCFYFESLNVPSYGKKADFLNNFFV
jgi:hypothetical protein